ncbi:hypothetical protein [Rhodococcus koreensis]|uniref:hypothetical protein n=1 Tax=Rhodococcus koreensis TaxID=99653 RepID=UPI0036DCE83E
MTNAMFGIRTTSVTTVSVLELFLDLLRELITVEQPGKHLVIAVELIQAPCQRTGQATGHLFRSRALGDIRSHPRIDGLV